MSSVFQDSAFPVAAGDKGGQEEDMWMFIKRFNILPVWGNVSLITGENNKMWKATENVLWDLQCFYFLSRQFISQTCEECN